MIKESKIKELVYDKVAKMLDNELLKYGFKFLKSKRYFLRQDNGFNQIINLHYPYSPISYDENTEKLFLTFNISTEIEIPAYEKWYFENIGESPNFSCRTENLTSQIELSFNDFDQDSFYAPTPSQEFKHFVSKALINSTHQETNIIAIDDLLKSKIPDLISTLSNRSDILKIFENRKYPLEHTYLLLFGGYTEIANQQLDKTYQYYIEKIDDKLKISAQEASESIKRLEDFIKKVEKITRKTYSNPYSCSIKILKTQSENFEFSVKTRFNEILRLDISQFDVRAFHINSLGDTLIFSDNKNIIKLNAKGEILLEKEIEPHKGYEKFLNLKTGLIPETDEFYVNNYIITKNNTITELILPVEKKSNKKLLNPHIIDLVYSIKNEKYLVLYENYILTYSLNGELLKTADIEKSSYNRIIPEKEWIVIQKRDAANLILDFNGQLIGNYEYGNGNNRYEFSTSYEYLICFFYSTKSQFYDLTNGKKATLWAHPTFIKDYKEIMYNDINHNFGMTIAKFSPDCRYIVGGADHGKYVAWSLPKLDRIELIPQTEVIDQLLPEVKTEYSAQGSREFVTKPELVVLENQTFLKNRGNDLSNIIFLENGDIFLTEIGYGKFILSWDRNFNNITYRKIDGRIDFHSNKYLTKKTNTELVIYEQI